MIKKIWLNVRLFFARTHVFCDYSHRYDDYTCFVFCKYIDGCIYIIDVKTMRPQFIKEAGFTGR